MKKLMKAVAALMLMIIAVCTVGCVKDSGNSSYYGHECVDLGLPSGTLWATCNVGADKPEGYGNYFAWGEIQPKETYNWSNYKYSIGDGVWIPNPGVWEDLYLTKYCTLSSLGNNGFTDNQTTLFPEDDAAEANWSRGWRMPTREDWQELLDNTTNTWTTQDGVNGKLFTAANGKSLFLPAAGSCVGDESASGHYWSMSLNAGYPHYAMGLYFVSDDCVLIDECRRDGFSVRPVHSVHVK